MPSKIEWTDETWNPITGCTPISAGCKNCYAKRMSRRLAGRHGYPEAPRHFDVTFHPDRLEQPHKWRKPRKIFVCSMSDLFHEDVPFDRIADIFTVMKACYARGITHKFQILTKRPERMLAWFQWWRSLCASAIVASKNMSNIWLGVTAENQKQADKRIPILLRIPAAVHGVSIEPCLGNVDLSYWLDYDVDVGSRPALDWVIVGAETGSGKRTMDLDWARSIRDQCQAAGVPFFFKKDSDGNHELDGRVWEEFPNATG